jgi:hypothetical protein
VARSAEVIQISGREQSRVEDVDASGILTLSHLHCLHMGASWSVAILARDPEVQLTDIKLAMKYVFAGMTRKTFFHFLRGEWSAKSG